MSINESIVEDATLEWSCLCAVTHRQVGELGHAIGHGPHMPAAPSPRPSPTGREIVCGEGKLAGRLQQAIRRLNPAKRRTRTRPLPKGDVLREDALRKVLRVATPSLVQTNRAFHRTCASLSEQAAASRTQTRTLPTLRDTLLPKLLNGAGQTHLIPLFSVSF